MSGWLWGSSKKDEEEPEEAAVADGDDEVGHGGAPVLRTLLRRREDEGKLFFSSSGSLDHVLGRERARVLPARGRPIALSGERVCVRASLLCSPLLACTETLVVADLIKAHREDIDKLREQCKDILEAEHDDLWLLRYVLSRKDKAEAAVRKGLQWRKENAKWLSLAKTGGKAPHADRIERYTAVGLHKRNCDGGAVMIIRAGVTPVKQLMEVVTVAELTEWFMFKKEETFIICDEATRRTGKLVKTVVLNDATGVPGMWELTGLLRNNGLMTALGDSSKLSESVYPQLVSVSVILNPPGFVRMVFKLVRVFMSASMMEKVKLCSGDIVNGDINDCPYAAKLVAIPDIPTFLGGQSECTIGAEHRDLDGGNADPDTAQPTEETAPAAGGKGKGKKKKGKKGK